MYTPITKYLSSPVTSWNVRRLGETMVTALTSKSLCLSSHSKATPPWCGLVAFDKITQYPEIDFGYRSSVSFVSVKTQQLTPIWHKPFAAAVNPDPHALLMFQVATEKVPLPPDRGGADETDIGVNI
jgi:hypothetical protein